MEKIVRYKLHKVKKQWVTIAVAGIAAIGLGVATPHQTVSADTTDAATALVETPVENLDEEIPEITATEQNDTVDTETADSSTGEKPVEVTAEASQNAGADENTPVVEEAEQVVTEDSDISTETTDEEIPVADEAVATAAEPAVTNKVALTNEVEKAAVAEDGTDATNLNLDNIKNIDGTFYYVNEDGSVKKNFAITVEGQLLYFDAETGALTSTSTYSFTEGLTNMVDNFSKNNQAYDSTEDSFETVDGYLTADSWYRPKAILENGETWVESTEEDLRPLLMAWWPDVDTQVGYLNYMSDYFNLDVNYSAENSQAELNLAAEAIQVKIEQAITTQETAAWLREVMNSFVITESKWNIDSESKGDDHLQGGALLYVNSDLTPWADSDYRLLNRTPTFQNGETNYFKADRTGGYEFLLANDVDNSNPIVQAEQLNQLYYLMNWGSIVFGDDDANFDGVRVDAVDNVNADLLQIYTNLFEAAYGVHETEAKALAHISILEAWSHNDPDYNKDTNGAALAMDNGLRLSLLYTLTRPVTNEANPNETRTARLGDLIDSYYGMTNRAVDDAYGDTMASYAFVRAHDSEVQTIIAQIIQENINPESNGFAVTFDELEQAFAIYNADMNSAEKKYTHYNIPAAYALLTSYMEMVPRVYYGDLYTDNGQYMETKSPYYDAIDALLRSRIKYSAGGQKMDITYLPGDASMAAYDESSLYFSTGVLTSVRYGQEIMKADDTEGTELSRTSGWATIVSNNPMLSLDSSAKLTINMGQIHANQAYRPLLYGTADGVQVYLNDSDTNIIRYTDAQGNLTFTADEIKGYSTVDMSGYLAVWVPVGASDSQDIRVEASTETRQEGEQTYQATAAMESQVIYEGFSNFQDFAQTEDQYTNKVIAENIELFKAWGVTSFEMAPQYVSTDDGTFLDSVIQNGYAFDDRYDLAMSQNNKYGSAEDLRDVLKALHAAGIQAIADWVPDQIYTLPGQEVVTARRVNAYGEDIPGAEIKNTLYVANTKSSGEDYQAVYGGEFLEYLQEMYPEMFEAVMISTGEKIDPSTKIKVWKAEYFNGTNILGRGAGYVLSDQATGTYFNIAKDGSFLPKQLTSNSVVTGFYFDGSGISYFSTSGYRTKSNLISYNGNYYYFDDKGYMVNGTLELDGETYYFLPNGIQLRDAIYEDAQGNQYYFGKLGNMYKDDFYSFDVEVVKEDGTTETEVKWRHFDENGVMARGLVDINGSKQFYDQDGYQVKGQFVTDNQGHVRYFLENSGEMLVSDFAKSGDNDWYYFDSNGVAVTGAVIVNGQHLYFNADGRQAKGIFVTNADNTISYYDADSGEKIVAKFFTTGNNTWYYSDAQGNLVTGSALINGQNLYFHADGRQAKGEFVTLSDGSIHYYDADSGEMLVNDFAKSGNNDWYYFDSNGKAVIGFQTVRGQSLYFRNNGKQVKGQSIVLNNRRYYFDANSGEQARNTWVTLENGSRVFFGARGYIAA